MGLTDDRRRPAALDFEPMRKASSDSTSTTSSLGKPPRTPRFAEATSIHSPIEPRGDTNVFPESQPADIGFGYINSNRESTTMPMSPRSPLKSALRMPGTPGRGLNPLSPTFREEQVLEKREASTDVEQVKDLVCISITPRSVQRAFSLTRLPENKNQGPDGKVCSSWSKLQLRSDRARYAVIYLDHLQHY